MATLLRIPGKRLTVRPPWPFTINWNSWESRGLIFWMPMAGGPPLEMVGRIPAKTLGGNVGGYTNSRMGSLQRFPAAFNGYRIANSHPTLFDVTAANTAGIPLTFAFWVMVDSVGAAQHVLCGSTNASSANLMTMGLTATGVFSITRGSMIRSSLQVAIPGTLYHVVIASPGTVTAATCHLYVNGIDQLSGTATNGFATTGSTDWFVGNSALLNTPLLGSMSDLRIYNRVFSATEAMDLYTRSGYYDLYQPVPEYLSIAAAGSAFLPRLAVLGAG